MRRYKDEFPRSHTHPNLRRKVISKEQYDEGYYQAYPAKLGEEPILFKRSWEGSDPLLLPDGNISVEDPESPLFHVAESNTPISGLPPLQDSDGLPAIKETP